MDRETLRLSHRPARGGRALPQRAVPWPDGAPEMADGSDRERRGFADAERDRLFMVRVRAGDEEAFRHLFDAYWERLVVYAATVMGAGDECQDVVLQAFVRVWSHREEWDGMRAVRPYLYRITRNLALNAGRDRRRRAARHRQADLIEPLSQHHRTPDQRFDTMRLRGEVEAAIDQLPERRRDAFVLSRFHGLSHREIADTLGISPQTVANQLSSAMADLRMALAHHLRDH